MIIINKRKIRDCLRLAGAIVFSWLYIPHMISYIVAGKKRLIDSDIVRLKKQVNIVLPNWLADVRISCSTAVTMLP